MANYNYESLNGDPWGVNRAADNIGQIFAQRARNQYLARERAAQQQRQVQQDAETKRVNDARIGEITESTRKTRLGNEASESQARAQAEVVQWVRTNIVLNPDGSLTVRPEGAKEMGNFMAGMVGSSRGGNDAALTFKNTMGAVNAPVEAEKNRVAAGQRNTDSIKGRLIGDLIRQQTAPADTVTTVYPGEKGREEIENLDPVTEKRSGWFGWDWLAADRQIPQTRTNTIPATPTVRITQRVPAGTAMQPRVLPNPPAPSFPPPPATAASAPTNAPALPRPTRAQARDYVARYGDQAKAQLQSEGYDVTGYAD